MAYVDSDFSQVPPAEWCRPWSEVELLPALDGSPPPPPVWGTRRAQVAALLASGLSKAQIAARLNISKSTVKYHSSAVAQHRRPPTAQRDAEIVAARQTMTLKATAAHCGVSLALVKRVLKEHREAQV